MFLKMLGLISTFFIDYSLSVRGTKPCSCIIAVRRGHVVTTWSSEDKMLQTQQLLVI